MSSNVEVAIAQKYYTRKWMDNRKKEENKLLTLIGTFLIIKYVARGGKLIE